MKAKEYMRLRTGPVLGFASPVSGPAPGSASTPPTGWTAKPRGSGAAGWTWTKKPGAGWTGCGRNWGF